MKHGNANRRHTRKITEHLFQINMQARHGGGSGRLATLKIMPPLSMQAAMSTSLAALSTIVVLRRVPLSGWICDPESQSRISGGRLSPYTKQRSSCSALSGQSPYFTEQGGGTANRGGPAESQETGTERNRGPAASVPMRDSGAGATVSGIYTREEKQKPKWFRDCGKQNTSKLSQNNADSGSAVSASPGFSIIRYGFHYCDT